MKNTDKSGIAIIGDEDLISGLEIFGFDIFSVNEKDELKDIFKKILEKDYLICFIQERYFPKIRDLFLEIKERPFPMLLPFPDHRGIEGEALGILREMSIKAIGQDILR